MYTEAKKPNGQIHHYLFSGTSFQFLQMGKIPKIQNSEFLNLPPKISNDLFLVGKPLFFTHFSENFNFLPFSPETFSSFKKPVGGKEHKISLFTIFHS